MSNQIETYDRKRKKFRGGYVLSDIVFLTAFTVRSAIKIAGSGTGAWRIAFFLLIFLNLIAAVLFHIMAVPLRDPMVLIITSLLVGFGSFDCARYFLDR